MKRTVSSIGLVSSFALAVGCGGPPEPARVAVYTPPSAAPAQPATPTVVYASTDPSEARRIQEFTADVRRDMDRIESESRQNFSVGAVPAVAIQDLRNRRTYIESLLQQYATDGRLQSSEREHVRDLVREMSRAQERFERAARGGGPIYIEQ